MKWIMNSNNFQIFQMIVKVRNRFQDHDTSSTLDSPVIAWPSKKNARLVGRAAAWSSRRRWHGRSDGAAGIMAGQSSWKYRAQAGNHLCENMVSRNPLDYHHYPYFMAIIGGIPYFQAHPYLPLHQGLQDFANLGRLNLPFSSFLATQLWYVFTQTCRPIKAIKVYKKWCFTQSGISQQLGLVRVHIR